MSRARLGRLGAVAACAFLVAGITAVVYFIRAGGAGAGNWPVQFELGMSDNGVLFQFVRDIFEGRPLDWTFSPQVFVFPEIPISLIAYLIAGGAVQLYYVVVAMINNALLFVAIFAIVRAIYPRVGFLARAFRAMVAMVPLVVLPLVGTITLFEFQLAPTYYFGLYLALVFAPLIYLAKRRSEFIVAVVALVLTIASNPLTLVFTLPALICIGLVRGVTVGFRSTIRPLVYALVIIAIAAMVRFGFLNGLQGTSPFSYLDASQVPNRVATLLLELRRALQSPIDITLCLLGLVLALGLFVYGVQRSVSIMRRRRVNDPRDLDPRTWTMTYFAFAPFTGLVACVVLLILNYLYLWPILVAPLVYVFLGVRGAWLRRVGAVAVGLLVVALVATTIVVAPTSPTTYLSYRDPETRCLDEALPKGMNVGYAGYFDARRLELTSHRDLLLIQIDYSGRFAYGWLTNREYPQDHHGDFFFVGSRSGQLTISAAQVTKNFGQPDKTITCGDGSQVLIYTSTKKLQRIAAKYDNTNQN